MKALGVVGSYRKGGINDTVVNAILEGVAMRGGTTEKLFLADKRIGFCRNCRKCVQQPGIEPGPCVLKDDVPGLIRKCLRSDILILSSPVNFGSATAVSKAFLERMVCLAHWPWGKPIPQLRRTPGKRLAVLVTSSAAPALMGRFGGFHALSDLGKIAETLQAEIVAKLHYGLMGIKPESNITESQRLAAIRLGRCLVDRFSGNVKARLELRVLRRVAQSDLPQIPYLGTAIDRLASIPLRV